MLFRAIFLLDIVYDGDEPFVIEIETIDLDLFETLKEKILKIG